MSYFQGLFKNTSQFDIITPLKVSLFLKNKMFDFNLKHILSYWKTNNKNHKEFIFTTFASLFVCFTIKNFVNDKLLIIIFYQEFLVLFYLVFYIFAVNY